MTETALTANLVGRSHNLGSLEGGPEVAHRRVRVPFPVARRLGQVTFL